MSKFYCKNNALAESGKELKKKIEKFETEYNKSEALIRKINDDSIKIQRKYQELKYMHLKLKKVFDEDTQKLVINQAKILEVEFQLKRSKIENNKLTDVSTYNTFPYLKERCAFKYISLEYKYSFILYENKKILLLILKLNFVVKV